MLHALSYQNLDTILQQERHFVNGQQNLSAFWTIQLQHLRSTGQEDFGQGLQQM